jgi:hypothetical protein
VRAGLVTPRFFLAEPARAEARRAVAAEQAAHGDVELLRGQPEAYGAVPHQTLAMLRYFSSNSSVLWIIKTDDDVFLRADVARRALLQTAWLFPPGARLYTGWMVMCVRALTARASCCALVLSSGADCARIRLARALARLPARAHVLCACLAPAGQRGTAAPQRQVGRVQRRVPRFALSRVRLWPDLRPDHPACTPHPQAAQRQHQSRGLAAAGRAARYCAAMASPRGCCHGPVGESGGGRRARAPA